MSKYALRFFIAHQEQTVKKPRGQNTTSKNARLHFGTALVFFGFLCHPEGMGQTARGAEGLSLVWVPSSLGTEM
jgi:hypothetical protein